MAENWASRLNPVTRVRERWDNFRAHPFQNLTSMLLGGVGSIAGGPAVGMALNRGSRAAFGNMNNREFQRDANQVLSDTRNSLDGQIWGGTQQMIAKPISYGGMSGITSPQRGNYPTPQGPQQSALASLLGLNNYQGNSPGSGLPGITSPNTFDGSPSYGMSGGLGTPNYAYGNPTISPYLSGNFSQSQSPRLLPLIDMDYGQNPDIVLNQDGGLPGITGPNIYSGTPSAPTGLDAMSGGGARDSFAGGQGSSDWGATFASLGMQGSSGGSHNSMAGPTAIADSLAGQSALRNRLREQLRQNPNDQSALALREQMIANRGGSR